MLWVHLQLLHMALGLVVWNKDLSEDPQGSWKPTRPFPPAFALAVTPISRGLGLGGSTVPLHPLSGLSGCCRLTSPLFVDHKGDGVQAHQLHVFLLKANHTQIHCLLMGATAGAFSLSTYVVPGLWEAPGLHGLVKSSQKSYRHGYSTDHET